MANLYIYNVVTVDGAALIAQATAANPIVYVAALSKATAAESEADLATRPASWYDGKTGGIAAASAMGNVARVVAVWGNAGSAQPAKSLAVTARLASQSDAQAVVLTAMSDPDSSIILPGADDVQGGVGVSFNVALNASGDVEVTPGAAASIADLARFVSLHKAGDPTQGDAQTILGAKTFSDGISVDYITLPPSTHRPGMTVAASIYPEEDNEYGLGVADCAWSSVRAWETHTTTLQNDIDSDNPTIAVSSSLIPNGTISLGDANHRWQYLHCDEAVTANVTSPSRTCTLMASQTMIGEVKFMCDLDSSPVRARIHMYDADSGETADLYFNHAAFYADSSYDAVDLGTNSHKFGTVYANNLHGKLPAVEGQTEPEVGAIFFAGIKVAGALNAGIGRTAKVGSPLVQGGSNITEIGSASLDTQTSFSTYTPFSTTDGTYKLLCGSTKAANDDACFALVMRIA